MLSDDELEMMEQKAKDVACLYGISEVRAGLLIGALAAYEDALWQMRRADDNNFRVMVPLKNAAKQCGQQAHVTL